MKFNQGGRKMAKMTFVIPRSAWRYRGLLHPPLGVGYLAAILREKDYSVSVIDGQFLNERQFYQEIGGIESEIVGISVTMAQLTEAVRVARVIRNNSPNTLIVLGGPGANLVEPQTFLSNCVDIVVRGEAERNLPLLLESIKKGISLKRVPNLAYRENGRTIFTVRKAPFPNLNELPFPTRDIFCLECYFERQKRFFGERSLGVITSRGCPHRCVFCDKSISGCRFRTRSAEDVVAELKLVTEKYSLDKVFFQDAAFTVSEIRVLKICRRINDIGLDIVWSALARVDEVNREMLLRMKQAGCTDLNFGVESGSNRILEYLKKGFDTSQIIRAFDLCHEIGIFPGASFIVGIPGEKEEDIEATIRLIKRIRPHFLEPSYLMPFPHTPLYHQTKRWISIDSFMDLEEAKGSVYQYPFEVDPEAACSRIFEAFRETNEKAEN